MLEEVAMNIFHILCFSILILATYIDTITSDSCDGRSITYVGMNSSSFQNPCPDDIVSCRSVTVDELIKNSTAATRNTCSNDFLFQQGSYDAKKIESKNLTFLAFKDLVIRGQDNVTITCIDDSTISLSKASNITIRELKFQACSIDLMASSIIIVTNS